MKRTRATKAALARAGVRRGQRVRVFPQTLVGDDDGSGVVRADRAKTGVVVYIHPEGRWYMVAFKAKGGRVRECFMGGTNR